MLIIKNGRSMEIKAATNPDDLRVKVGTPTSKYEMIIEDNLVMSHDAECRKLIMELSKKIDTLLNRMNGVEGDE